MRGPYCTGALTPSGNASRLRAPQGARRQSWARCSVTTRGAGSGRSKTWRALWPVDISKRHRRPTGRAGRREVIDHLVGLVDLKQGLAFVAFLPARRPSRRLARAPDPSRLLEPIAGRRLAAIGTVQSHPALKFRNPRFERRNLGRLRRHQRNQLFPRRLAVRIRIRNHRILESKRDSAVEKKLRAQSLNLRYLSTWAVTKI